jgi:hypothetical protein
MPHRLALAVRYLCITAGVIGAAGLTGSAISWTVLTAALGPRAYVFAAHPHTAASRWRNAVIGHTAAIGAGVASLAVFGLWHHASVSATGAPTLAQVGASAAAGGATVALLEIAGAHHAPAAASALLVSTGLARPGRPLEGLVVGLGIVLVLGLLSSRLSPGPSV